MHVNIDEVNFSSALTLMTALKHTSKNQLKQEKSRLTKWGPLSTIYRNLYSRNADETEQRIQNQLETIRDQITREVSCTAVYSDQAYLRSYLRELLHEADQGQDLYDEG